MKKNKLERIKIGIIIGSFILLIGLGIILASSILAFNNTKRHYKSQTECPDFEINISPRTGKTDSWAKILEENGEDVDYIGTIYDVNINNIGSNNISKWQLRIDISDDMYLNNGWCGRFEIHQKVGEREYVEIVDLRDYDTENIDLVFTYADPDLLIPLHEGDYVIYYPDYASDEYPILQGSSNKLTEISFGFIVYNKADTTISFTNYSVDYYLEEILVKNPMFIVLCVCLILWVMSTIAYSAVKINLRKAHVRFKQDESIINQSIGVFTRFFEAKDIYTNGHSQRVAQYSKMIVEKAGFNDDTVRKIYYIALMHDCGKCYIPDAILKKPGKLTNEEYEVIKSHTVKGAEMLADFTSVEHIRDGVLYHHERYDGKGYPEGLKGEEIPLVARIICIADSFDAMNSRRCYRNYLTKDYIISEIENNKGKQFDPHYAEVFLQVIRDGKIKFTSETISSEENN